MYHEPATYVKWGAICVFIGIVPNVEIVGIGMIALGIALELINRKAKRVRIERISNVFSSEVSGEQRAVSPATIVDGESREVRGDS